MAERCSAQTINVIRRRATKTAPYNLAVAFTRARMTDRAVDVEALLPALKHFTCERERQLLRVRIKRLRRFDAHVVARITARHCAEDCGSCRLPVGEEGDRKS